MTTNPSSGKRVPLSVTLIIEYANSYLRVKVLLFTGPSDFSYERIITPLEGELVSRDCLKRLLVLKPLCKLMKDYGRKSLGQGALLADYDQLDG